MKKTKKMLAAMLAVSTLAAALSGCSGGNKTDGSLEFTEAASADGNNGTTEAGASESSEAETDPNGEKPSPEVYGILREASTAKIGSLNPLTYTQSYASTQIKRSSMTLYGYFPSADYTACEIAGELAAESRSRWMRKERYGRSRSGKAACGKMEIPWMPMMCIIPGR